MDDGVTEAESLLNPIEEDDDDDYKKHNNRQEGGEERTSGSFFSNLVSGGGEADHGEKGGGKEEEKRGGGGLLDHIISNLVSPLSHEREGKEEGHEVSQVRDEGTSSEDQVQKKQKVARVVDEENHGQVKAEEEGCTGGGIIDHIVSHLPTSLPDDAAPTTDEASILIHSIIHD